MATINLGATIPAYPMPVSLCIACSLVETVECGLNEIFIGDIQGTYGDEAFLRHAFLFSYSYIQ